MWSAEPYRAWMVVGRDLGLALLLIIALTIPGALLIVRRVRPGPRVVLGLIGTALATPLVFLVLWRVTPHTFYGLTCKEGWVELSTLPPLLMAATVFFHHAFTQRPRIWNLAWAVLCLLVVLEEIDWGQLVWGFATPGWALAVGGRSDRLNFHNTGAATIAFAALILAVFVLLPVAARLRGLAPRLARLGLRPPSLPLAAAVLLVVFGWNTLGLALGVDAHLQEVTELSLALLLVALSLDYDPAVTRPANHCGFGNARD